MYKNNISYVIVDLIPQCLGSAAGVVVSCKIPILATRVRFPGDAHLFFPLWLLSEISQTFAAELYNSARVA